MNEDAARASIAAMVGQIRRYVPIMAPYFEIETPLGEYASGLHANTPDPVHDARQQAVAVAVQRVLRQALGPAASTLHIDSDDIRAMNIVDHHQLLNHPLLLGTNIIGNANRLTGEGDPRPIITLSCSNVPPNNYYMRNGFQLHGTGIPYFAVREKNVSIYYAAARAFDFLTRLRSIGRWEKLPPTDQEFLIEYANFLNNLDYSHTAWHRDQLAVAIHGTWPMLFAPELRPALPRLLYANSEDVTRECLIELLSSDNFISAALLDPTFRRHILDAFRGVVVAWDEARGKGTHFFWRKHPRRPELLRMFIQDGKLIPTDPRHQQLAIPLEVAPLRAHLAEAEIIPSVALSMSILLYAGIRPLVGPGSLVYITQLRDGWAALLARSGQSTEADLMKKIDTGGLIAGTPMFFARSGGVLRTLYAAEVFCRGGMPEHYLRTVLRTPMKDLLAVGSSGVYDLFATSYIPKDKQFTERVGFDDAAAVIHRWL